ncbi:MAG: hypothetical protein IJ390_11415 [Lachnospiraceae bacterium]|nr:hypothetical protein [Lachnospiraceae bacterium]
MKLFSPKNIVLVFAVFLLLSAFVCGTSDLSAQSAARQKQSLEEALRRSIITCYAQNGFYPESLEYLLSHYPILYDDSRYIIHYQPVASNLMPDVTVLERK